MEVTSVNLARVTAFLPAGIELTIGRVPFQVAAKFLCERYGFTQSPKTLEEWQKPEGAIFSYGQREGIIITRLLVYARGFAVETQTSTDDCEKVIQDLLSAASTGLGLSIPRPIMRRLYYSELTYLSEASLNSIHPALSLLGDRVTPFVESFVPGAKYEVTGIYVNTDEWNVKYSAGYFRIERRTGSPFHENAYFSAAPMPTGEHIKALQDCEAALLREHQTR